MTFVYPVHDLIKHFIIETPRVIPGGSSSFLAVEKEGGQWGGRQISHERGKKTKKKTHETTLMSDYFCAGHPHLSEESKPVGCALVRAHTTCSLVAHRKGSVEGA